MKICVLSDEYLPDSQKNHARMLHELAVEFFKQGHEVTVITPRDKPSTEGISQEDLDGVKIWRFKTFIARGTGKIRRAVFESIMSQSAIYYIKKASLNPQFDICINYSPSIFFAYLNKWLKAQGSFNFLILRDFFPQWVIDEGIISSKGALARYFRYIESMNYKSSDVIAVQSDANIEIFRKTSPFNHSNVRVLYNWSTTELGCSLKYFGESFLVKHKLKNKILLFYGGNIGHAQDMTNLMKLARGLKPISKAHILLIGRGDEVELVKRLKKSWDLDNVSIFSSMTQAEYDSVLQLIDIGLFSLSRSHKAHNFPGKLLGYMKYGKPILGSVNSGNDLMSVINLSGAGLVTLNGDDSAFLKNALSVINDSSLRGDMGLSSRRLLEDKFTVNYATRFILDTYAISTI